MKEEFFATFKPRDNIPDIQKSRVQSKWAAWIDQVNSTRETLCLTPPDRHKAHILRNAALNVARRKGITINTRLVTEEDELKLYIWCP